MIEALDIALLETLRKGLKGQVPEADVVLGMPEPGKMARVYLYNDDFIIEDTCMGSLAETMYEEADEAFDGDSKTVEFRLAKAPVREVKLVEYPKGTVRFAPDDYGADEDSGVITFRDPPPRGKGNIHVQYTLPDPVGEMSFLRFVLTYSITIVSGDRGERDKLTLAAIEALYKDLAGLAKNGVEELRLVKGFTAPPGEDKSNTASVLLYSVTTSMKIERPMLPMAKIDIKSKAQKK